MATPSRLVLEGVPKVHFYQPGPKCPEDITFPSALRACLEYLGDDIGCDNGPNPGAGLCGCGYGYLCGTSGIGFSLLWHRERFDLGITDARYIADDPSAAFRRAFNSVGWSCDVIFQDADHGEAEFRAKIIESIGRGRPVIALGVFGPPEAAIVTGYDEGGDVLLGWNFFAEDSHFNGGIEFEPSGYFRARDWYANTPALILIGEQGARPEWREVCRNTLQWAIEVVRRPMVGEYHNGLAAYEAWAQALSCDEDFPADNLDLLRERYGPHNNAIGQIAEGRHYAMLCLHEIAPRVPEIRHELGLAMGCYKAQHDLMWVAWGLVGGNGGDDGKVARLGERGVRERLMKVIRQARDKDAEAAVYMERALLKLGVPATEIPYASMRGDTEPSPARLEQERKLLRARERTEWREGADLVQGVPLFDWWNRNVTCFIGALTAALAPTEHPYSYTDLMGFSGLAFRTRWYRDFAGDPPWHPDSPHGEQAEEIAALARATGWRLQAVQVPEGDKPGALANLTSDLVLSVNRGLPVVVGYATDLGVVYGVHEWNQHLLLRDYQRSDQAELLVPNTDERLHSPFVFLNEHAPGLARREAFVESLAIAVSNGRRERLGRHRFGLNALATWREDLAGCAGYPEAQRGLLWMVNWWCLMHFADARRSAVAYLEAHKGLLQREPLAAVERALGLYRQEADLLTTFTEAHRDCIQWWGGTKCVADWTTEMREQQREALAQARALEEAALAALAAAGGG